MAVLRNLPYGNQHFLVDIGDGSQGVTTAFSEVVLPDISIDVVSYRTGSDKESGVHKLAGLARYENVVLRRGLIGSLNLYEWIDQVRNGDPNARRTVVISLQSEDLSEIVFTWRLFRAWPVKYSASDLNAQGNDVVIETLELAYERLEIE